MKFFIVCPRGLEIPLAEELKEISERPEVKALGAWVIDPPPLNNTGGLGVAGPMSVALAINLHSRIASRCLLQMTHVAYRKEDDVYKAVRSLSWEDWITPDQTMRVDLTAHRSPLTSLNFVTLRIKDAVCDRLREVKGARPNIDTELPDVRVQAHLTATHATVYLDTSGQSLFKRGWRDDKGAAPLKENLAAGILALTGWKPEQPLFDPMCGSGTFLIEAAYRGLGIPSGSIRAGLINNKQAEEQAGQSAQAHNQSVKAQDKAEAQSKFTRYRPTRVDLVGADQGFGFQRLKPFNTPDLKKQWDGLCEVAKKNIEVGLANANKLKMAACDINENMITIVKNNWKRAGLPAQSGVLSNVRQIDALVAKSPFAEPGVMLFNPPYGERLEIKGGRDGSERVKGRGARDALPKNNNSPEFMEFLNQFGKHLKDNFQSWQVDVLTADMGLPGQVRMKESKRTPLFNGPLECRLFRFDMKKPDASSSAS
jgi:putative N6-adenine-specific DNA methylase